MLITNWRTKWWCVKATVKLKKWNSIGLQITTYFTLTSHFLLKSTCRWSCYKTFTNIESLTAIVFFVTIDCLSQTSFTSLHLYRHCRPTCPQVTWPANSRFKTNTYKEFITNHLLRFTSNIYEDQMANTVVTLLILSDCQRNTFHTMCSINVLPCPCLSLSYLLPCFRIFAVIVLN